MTKNQIEYLKYKESQRANLKQEELAAARDAVSKELGFATLSETSRHNIAAETHNTAVLGENQRHNLAQERHNSLVLGEQTRANMAREALERSAQAETARHNVRLEVETSRHNIATESLQSEQNRISSERAAEERRSNLARESETSRSNLAREAETKRSNVARENETERYNRDVIRQRELDRQLGYAQLGETSRYHTQSIALGQSQLAETVRSHRASEAETRRANVAQEGLIKARDKMNFEETVRSHVVGEEISRLRADTEAQRVELEMSKLDETVRHNQQMEQISTFEQARKTIESGSRLIPLFLGG